MNRLFFLLWGGLILSFATLFIDTAGYYDEGALILIIVLLALTIAGTYRKVVHPLSKLNHKATLIQTGELNQNGEAPMGKEFDSINKTLSMLTQNSQNAIEFIKQIEEGNLDAPLLVTNNNGAKEGDKLGQSLESLRMKLNEISASEKKRNWATEGVARFVEILRSNNEDLQSLSDKILSNLVQYIKANQGQLYIVNEDNPESVFLELAAFYAFDRKKYYDRKIEIGEGLVGQVYLEKQTIMLTEVPENYVKVTSGLGESNPRCILLTPLKLNDMVYGVLELASFECFKDYEVEFIEKIGESIASTIANAKTNQKTRGLVEELQQKSEEMKAQEEEMRQNMEELQSTQEEMSRKEKEINRLLEESNANERKLEEQLRNEQGIKKQLELENAMFTGLMDMLSDRITIKDTEGVYLRINKTKEDALKKQGINDVCGKSDRDIFGDEHFQRALKVEKQVMGGGSVVQDTTEKVKMEDGTYRWYSISRGPFKNKTGEVLGTIVISKNITKEVEMSEQLKLKEQELEKLKKR